MVTNKYITKIISALMALAVILCLATSAFSKQLQAVYGNNAVTMEYETELFDTDQVMDIDILMDEDDWNDMLENAISEEYYSCDVVVNGKKWEYGPREIPAFRLLQVPPIQIGTALNWNLIITLKGRPAMV